MKIIQHPRISSINIGDEVYSLPHNLSAHVVEVFPAAVCVKVGVLLRRKHMELFLDPQLWRADDIENLSVCHYCGGRDGLCFERNSGMPHSVCEHCKATIETTIRH